MEKQPTENDAAATTINKMISGAHCFDGADNGARVWWASYSQYSLNSNCLKNVGLEPDQRPHY